MTQTTIVGNLTTDPELRFTPSGAAVANFTVASTPRTFDKNSNEWKDGETLFMRCSVWRDAAENVAESLTRGTRVIVTGRLRSRSYEKDGEKRYRTEIVASNVILGGGGKRGESTERAAPRAAAAPATAPKDDFESDYDSEIPF